MFKVEVFSFLFCFLILGVVCFFMNEFNVESFSDWLNCYLMGSGEDNLGSRELFPIDLTSGVRYPYFRR